MFACPCLFVRLRDGSIICKISLPATQISVAFSRGRFVTDLDVVLLCTCRVSGGVMVVA